MPAPQILQTGQAGAARISAPSLDPGLPGLDTTQRPRATFMRQALVMRPWPPARGTSWRARTVCLSSASIRLVLAGEAELAHQRRSRLIVAWLAGPAVPATRLLILNRSAAAPARRNAFAAAPGSNASRGGTPRSGARTGKKITACRGVLGGSFVSCPPARRSYAHRAADPCASETK
jgi:hypothetical protein